MSLFWVLNYWRSKFLWKINVYNLSDILKLLKHEEQSFIYGVITLCKLVNVLNPATSASGKRSFCTAQRIKSCLRSTMTQARFNHLTILHTHKKKLDKLCLTSVANTFVDLNEPLHLNVGKFTEADFSNTHSWTEQFLILLAMTVVFFLKCWVIKCIFFQDFRLHLGEHWGSWATHFCYL